MPIALPFYPQETRYSCVPACLRMILAHMDILVDEAVLRECCHTDRLGTTVRDTVNCIQSYDLRTFAATDATMEQLEIWLANERYLIVYLNLFPIDTLWVLHAVVAEEVSGESVTLMDPIVGRRVVHANTFEQGWQMSKRQVIVIN